MNDLVERLTTVLEPILAEPDPRARLSAYHDMPYALFRYDPEAELELRRQVTQLATRLSNRGKRPHRISLAECLSDAMLSQRSLDDWIAVERELGTTTTIDTVHQILAEYAPLPEIVATKMPADADPRRDVVFIVRTGALFPVYRTFSLLEQLHGRVTVPTILFYPGRLDGAAGLQFMGVLEAEHNYRPKIF